MGRAVRDIRPRPDETLGLPVGDQFRARARRGNRSAASRQEAKDVPGSGRPRRAASAASSASRSDGKSSNRLIGGPPFAAIIAGPDGTQTGRGRFS